MPASTDYQPIAIDSGSFPELRRDGCVYVDKTAYFHRLITQEGAKRFFLARPRRFGKSLMISTLQAIFEGKRHLFDGLDIANTDWPWEKYPVLYFNFGFAAGSSAEEFAGMFANEVKRGILQAGGDFDCQLPPASNFGNAIDSLSLQNYDKGVVILIDEYDDPVAQLLHRPDEAECIRTSMSTFYHQMKDRTDKIRFLMITGVSKFTKMSVFSSLSNLVDLSFKDEYAAMLGYTEGELDRYFSGRMHAHAQRMGLSDEAYRAELKRWFNGYRFGKSSQQTVYNPVSIGINLADPQASIQPSWSNTGRASMLMSLLKRREYLSVNPEDVRAVQERELDVSDIRNLKTVPMLFQTGYLTIRDYNPVTRSFNLCVPNEEVRQDLASLTLNVLTEGREDGGVSLGVKLLCGLWDDFTTGLKALYASLPYGPTETRVQEYSYERVLATLLQVQGIQCRAEAVQADGRADLIATHATGIFIFELKVDESAEAALSQIKTKQYDAPYRDDPRPIWFIGLNFDRSSHLLLDCKYESGRA